MRPPKVPYLRFGEAERPIMSLAVEIVGNAKALLQPREQIDRALGDAGASSSAEVPALADAPGPATLDRTISTSTPWRRRCLSASGIGPGYTKQRSLPPGGTGTPATGAASTPGPCTLSCWSPKR